MMISSLVLLSGLTSLACADLLRGEDRRRMLDLAVLSCGAMLVVLQWAA